jgi:hypothetical protein
MSVDAQDITHEQSQIPDDYTLNSLASTFASFQSAPAGHTDRLNKLRQNRIPTPTSGFTNQGLGNIAYDNNIFDLPNQSTILTDIVPPVEPQLQTTPTFQPEVDSMFHFPTLNIATEPPVQVAQTPAIPVQPDLTMFGLDPVLDTPPNFNPVAEALEISKPAELLENRQQFDKEEVNSLSEPVVAAQISTELSPVIPDVQIEEVLTPKQIIENNIVKFKREKNSPDLRAFEDALNRTMSAELANNR